MKKVYLIGGTMGVGKTTVCQRLKTLTENCAILDGDWCWDMNPFVVNDETKKMVVENICFLLNSFISCSSVELVYFCWVMHEQAIVDDIISRLDTEKCEVKVISLVCSPEELEKRLNADIESGKRTPDIIERSTARIPLYDGINSVKIDVTRKTADETAEEILKL